MGRQVGERVGDRAFLGYVNYAFRSFEVMVQKNKSVNQQKSFLTRSKDEIRTFCEEQIIRGMEIVNMPVRLLPSGVYYGRRDVKYDEIQERDFTSAKKKWVVLVKEYLKQSFDNPDNDYLASFSRAGVSLVVVPGGDYIQEEKDEITAKVEYLEALVEMLPILPSSLVEDSYMAQSKSPKVFISHKKEDKAYADALVNLINNILGPEGDKIFCSSIPGYGIKQSRVIIDELKAQFDQFDVFMVIIHSPRYYKSTICLNEMGASWVLGTQFSSFLTKDFTPSQMKGVIGNDSIVIDLNDDQDVLNAHLNDFKNDLLSFFKSEQQIDENKWETVRSRFVKEVSGLTYDKTPKTDEDLFEKLYLPAFDHIFDLLDIDRFSEWGYDCAIGGYTILEQKVFYNIDVVARYVKSRPKHSSFGQWDSLMLNLGQLIVDFGRVFSIYAVKLRDDAFYVEPFYKAIPNNPNYDRDVEAYQQHVWLISDLLFEMARLCNLILSRIRLFVPDYKVELGVLFLENDFSVPDLVYQDSEISDAPYPGLNVFISERLNRETHYGNNPNIRADGYEK